MDYYYLQKSDNTKVWLPAIKARTRLEYVAIAGKFDFVGYDGHEYNVLDIQATDIYDFGGWSAHLMALFCGGLAFPYGWYYGLYAVFLGFILTRWRSVHVNCVVEHFNNSHFKILR